MIEPERMLSLLRATDAERLAPVVPVPVPVIERGWLTVSQHDWDEIQVAAVKLDALSAKASNTRRWNPRFNLFGLLGECVYGMVSRQPFSAAEKVRRAEAGGLADGGTDFPGVDVKATPHATPLLLRLRTDPLKAPFYALISFDLARRCGRYVGFATREMLDRAPDVEYGHGPTRTLGEESLGHGLPPV